MKLFVICFAILFVTVVKSNPVEEISEDSVNVVAEDIVADEVQVLDEIEGEAFKADGDDDEDSDEDSDEWTEEDKERIFGVDIPKCMEHTDLRVDLHFSHKSDCNKFYLCSYGKAHLMDCPELQHWSVHLDRCDYPKLAKCVPNGTYQFKVRKPKAIKAKTSQM